MNPVLRKPFACPFAPCEYRAGEKKTLRYHVTARHTQERTRDLQCSLCPSKFYCQATLKAHIHRHVRENKYHCQSCNYISHERAKLNLHIKVVHERSIKFACKHPGCAFTTRHRTNWKKHQQLHDPHHAAPRYFDCSFPNCSYRVSSVSRLKLHVDRRHNPNRAREFSCPLCSQAFFDRHSRETHVRRAHTKEKPHKCNLCSYAGVRAVELKIHYRRVHDKTADGHLFKCNTCDYMTEDLHQLRRPKSMVHTQTKRFHCDDGGCNFKTNAGRTLKTHKLLHEKDSDKQFPFTCTFPGCDYRRRAKCALKPHERVHETSRLQLTCKLCPTKHYPDAKSLRFHEFWSHRSRLYQCSLCAFGAPDKFKLESHKRRRHAVPQGVIGGHPRSVRAAEPAQGSGSFQVPTVEQSLLVRSVFHKVAVVVLRRINLIVS